MNKHKIYKIVIILALIISIMSPVSVSAAPSAGIKPGSIFYFFDITFEKIVLFFTFSPEKKAEKALEYADERLAEAEAVANENKPEAIAEAMENYQKNVSLATTEAKEIKDETKAKNLLTIIADNTSKHQETLAEVYNKVPDEAKQAIEKAIEISIKGQEEALKEIQALKKTVEDLQKDIESLKQQNQSDQNEEIEALQKEVEKLKSAQSAKPKIIEKVVEKIIEIPPPALQKSTTKLSNSEIIEKVKPAVVYIQTSDGSGSGMIIENNSYVLTNAHVVSGVSNAKIKLSDGRLFIGSIIGRDEKIDLAILKIKGNNFPVVMLGDSSASALKQGDEVFSFGYPFGLEGDVSFKEGTISRRQTYEGITYLETSAEVHPGNSGGPLVNRFAQVVGVNTQAVGSGVDGVLIGESIKFALPINLVRGLIPELKSGRNVVLPKIALPTIPSLPTPKPAPAPSCTKDTWDCSGWSECSLSGTQSRTCYKTYDCPVAYTPSPATSQNCTPPNPIPAELGDVSDLDQADVMYYVEACNRTAIDPIHCMKDKVRDLRSYVSTKNSYDISGTSSSNLNAANVFCDANTFEPIRYYGCLASEYNILAGIKRFNEYGSSNEKFNKAVFYCDNLKYSLIRPTQYQTSDPNQDLYACYYTQGDSFETMTNDEILQIFESNGWEYPQ